MNFGMRNVRKVLIMAVVLSISICGFLCADYAFAAQLRTGVVATTSLNVRSGAGIEYKPTGFLALYDKVTILNETYDRNGSKWYHIKYKTTKTGYASADYITVESGNEYVYDEKFENKLDTEGFPETYKTYLRKIHANHPEWTFKAAHTGLSWNDVIEKEWALVKSLVASGSPASSNS